MNEADYYAPGSYRDPSAPWNEPVIPEKDFDLTISQSLSKDVTVCTNNYRSEYDEEDGNSYINTDDTNWNKVYKEGHLTPLQLIHKFKEFLGVEMKYTEEELAKKHSPIRRMKRSFLKYLISECEGWIDNETVIVES